MRVLGESIASDGLLRDEHVNMRDERVKLPPAVVPIAPRESRAETDQNGVALAWPWRSVVLRHAMRVLGEALRAESPAREGLALLPLPRHTGFGLAGRVPSLNLRSSPQVGKVHDTAQVRGWVGAARVGDP